MQVFEIATHLWSRWAEIHGDEKLWKAFDREKPDDWTDLQVKGAKRALADQPRGRGFARDGDHPDGPRSSAEERRVREATMSSYGQVHVKNNRYKFQGDFHRLEQHMPIRNADDGWKLVGVTKPRDMTYVHTYGGEAIFFESLSQGKLLATKCDNPACEANGSIFQPFRIHCPDCLSKNTVIDMTDLAKKTATVHTFMVCERSGAFNMLDKPIRFINIEFEGRVHHPVQLSLGGRAPDRDAGRAGLQVLQSDLHHPGSLLGPRGHQGRGAARGLRVRRWG